MSKYKVGDNVVIRKDLEDGKHYRGFLWNENSMKLLKEMTSVKIDAIHKCQNGTAYAVYFNNFFIPDEMIEGLYKEEKEVGKYEVGNKVVLRKDLLLGEVYGNQYWTLLKDKELRSLPYIEITRKLANGDYIVDNGWTISDLEIAGLHEEPVEDETKYLWASDEYVVSGYKCIKFLIKGNNTRSHDVNSRLHREILKGKHDKFLMTESEAKEHHLFKAMNRIEVQKEDLYYIRFESDLGEGGYLNYRQSTGTYFVSDCDEEDDFKTKFTKEECDEIIGTSTILHKVLVE